MHSHAKKKKHRINVFKFVSLLSSALPGGHLHFFLDNNSNICLPDAAGGWSAWSGYGACSKSCHYGYQSRSRECNSPSSLACQGPSVHRRRCNEHVRCPSKEIDITTTKGQSILRISVSNAIQLSPSPLQEKRKNC